MRELPHGWTTATLSELIARDGLFTDGDWVETKDQDERGTVRLTQLADVGDGFFRDRSRRYMRADQAEALQCTYLKTGDVLVARMPDPLGRACTFPGSAQFAVTAVDVCIVRPGGGSVDTKWLMWFINAPWFRTRVGELQTGTTRKRISRKNLASIPLPVPPLAEQRRIVAAIEEQFSRLDAAAATLEHVELLLEVQAKTALESAFRSLPTADLGDLAIDIRYGTSTKCGYDFTGLPVLRIPNVAKGRIDLGDVKYAASGLDLASATVEPGDLLIVRTNGSRNLIGRAAPVVASGEPTSFASYLIRVRLDQARTDARFVSLVLASPRHRAMIESRAATTAGQYNLNIPSLRSLPIPSVGLEEQRRIVAKLEQQLSQIDALRAAVESAQRRSDALRRAILERAFRGELVPQDPGDEPASALLERIRAERTGSLRRRPKV